MNQRAGVGLLKLIVALALVGACTAVVLVAALNYRRDGRVSLRVLDPAWWQPGVDTAHQVKDTTADALWGRDGLIDTAERWWKGRGETGKAAHDGAGNPVAPEPAIDSPVSGPSLPPGGPAEVLAPPSDQRLALAEHAFQQGLEAYRQADPSRGQDGAHRRERVAMARERFARVRTLLEAALDDPSAAMAMDAERLADARALRQYNERLLISVDRQLREP